MKSNIITTSSFSLYAYLIVHSLLIYEYQLFLGFHINIKGYTILTHKNVSNKTMFNVVYLKKISKFIIMGPKCHCHP